VNGRTKANILCDEMFALAIDAPDDTDRNYRLDVVQNQATGKLHLPAEQVAEWIQRCTDQEPAYWRRVLEHMKQSRPPIGDVFGRSEYRQDEPPPFMGDLASDGDAKQVDWLVDGLLPLGELSVIGADGGTGKGMLVSQLIACVTTGKANPFFPTFCGNPSPVLVFSGEDDLAKVIKPRAMAAGADLKLLRVVEASEYHMATGKRLLLGSSEFIAIVREARPKLIIVDPLQSFLDGSVEMSARNEMRSVAIPFQGVCREIEAAGIDVMHTNKRGNVSGRMRLADSSDMWDMARSVLMLGRDSGTGLIYASHEKSSYAKPANTVMFRIEDTVVAGNVHTGLAVFQAYSDRHDADFIAEKKMQRSAVTKDDAKEAIIDALASAQLGSLESGHLKQLVAGDLGCSIDTVNKAYSELVKEVRIKKTVIRQKDGTNKWYSALTAKIPET
ncbi:MAG: AAA family ATPase, partial [Faecalibacterium sp.]|nr:AAA family ATPase [Faecalibacterium sp.]